MSHPKENPQFSREQMEMLAKLATENVETSMPSTVLYTSETGSRVSVQQPLTSAQSPSRRSRENSRSPSLSSPSRSDSLYSEGIIDDINNALQQSRHATPSKPGPSSSQAHGSSFLNRVISIFGGSSDRNAVATNVSEDQANMVDEPRVNIQASRHSEVDNLDVQALPRSRRRKSEQALQAQAVATTKKPARKTLDPSALTGRVTRSSSSGMTFRPANFGAKPEAVQMVESQRSQSFAESVLSKPRRTNRSLRSAGLVSESLPPHGNARDPQAKRTSKASKTALQPRVNRRYAPKGFPAFQTESDSSYISDRRKAHASFSDVVLDDAKDLEDALRNDTSELSHALKNIEEGTTATNNDTMHPSSRNELGAGSESMEDDSSMSDDEVELQAEQQLQQEGTRTDTTRRTKSKAKAKGLFVGEESSDDSEEDEHTPEDTAQPASHFNGNIVEGGTVASRDYAPSEEGPDDLFNAENVARRQAELEDSVDEPWTEQELLEAFRAVPSRIIAEQNKRFALHYLDEGFQSNKNESRHNRAIQVITKTIFRPMGDGTLDSEAGPGQELNLVASRNLKLLARIHRYADALESSALDPQSPASVDEELAHAEEVSDWLTGVIKANLEKVVGYLSPFELGDELLVKVMKGIYFDLIPALFGCLRAILIATDRPKLRTLACFTRAVSLALELQKLYDAVYEVHDSYHPIPPDNSRDKTRRNFKIHTRDLVDALVFKRDNFQQRLHRKRRYDEMMKEERKRRHAESVRFSSSYSDVDRADYSISQAQTYTVPAGSSVRGIGMFVHRNEDRSGRPPASSAPVQSGRFAFLGSGQGQPSRSTASEAMSQDMVFRSTPPQPRPRSPSPDLGLLAFDDPAEVELAVLPGQARIDDVSMAKAKLHALTERRQALDEELQAAKRKLRQLENAGINQAGAGDGLKLDSNDGFPGHNSKPDAAPQPWTREEINILLDGLRADMEIDRYWTISQNLSKNNFERSLDDVLSQAKLIKSMLENEHTKAVARNPNQPPPPLEPWITSIES